MKFIYLLPFLIFNADFTIAQSEPYTATVEVFANRRQGAIKNAIYGNNSWFEETKMGLPAQRKENIPDLNTYYNTNVAKFYSLFSDIFRTSAPTVIRVPGGLQANHENWRATAGPFANRPTRDASGVRQVAVAGLDEHIRAAHLPQYLNGAKIMYTLNAYPAGRDAATDARDLAQYIKSYEHDNTSGPRVGPNDRVTSYYEVGNELNSNLRPGGIFVRTNARSYAQRVSQLSNAIRGVDPGAKIGALDDFNLGLGNDWYQTVADEVRNQNSSFQFWIKHFYTPGTDGGVRGLTISKPNVQIETSANLPASSNYRFEFLAEGNKSGDRKPKFQFFVDGNSSSIIELNRFSGDNPATQFYSTQNIYLNSGPHRFAIKAVDPVGGGIYLRLHPSVGAISDRAGTPETVLDFKNDAKVVALAVNGGSLLTNQLDRERALFRNIPIMVTEWNSSYSFDECSPNGGVLKDKPNRCSKNTQLREAINLAGYYHAFVQKKDMIDGANFWLLFTELGWLNRSQNPNNNTPAISYYVGGMYSNNLRGEQIEDNVQSESYGIGQNPQAGTRDDLSGITMGHMNRDMVIPFVSSVASKNGNQVIVSIINRHPRRPGNVRIKIRDVNVQGTAELHQISGNAPSDSGANLYRRMNISVSGDFTFQAPKLSANLIKFTVR